MDLRNKNLGFRISVFFQGIFFFLVECADPVVLRMLSLELFCKHFASPLREAITYFNWDEEFEKEDSVVKHCNCS